MFNKRKKVQDVFTPRNHEVNHNMYIHRPELEKSLIRKIEGTKHVIMYGESGCGKSWLYKKVLSDKKIKYGIINLAKAKRMGSITNVFRDEIANRVKFEKTSYTDIEKAEIGGGFLKGELGNQNNYCKIYGDPVREYIRLYKQKNTIIVFDNLESIFSSSKLIEEFGDILTLLDDEDYKEKFLIVGVPSEVIQYFSSRELLKTVANRLTQLKEVKGLNCEQVKEFVEKGFRNELEVKLNESELNEITKHVFWVTNGTPQKLQEYCKLLGFEIQDNGWEYTNDMLNIVDKKWVLDSLHKNYTVISGMMNSIETDIGRRNQVLYCLGKLDKTCFRAQEVEKILQEEFKMSTKGRRLNISLILNDLSEWVNSFIKKNKNEYIITDKEYILCIRLMLYKTKEEKVEKLDLENIN